MQTLHFSFFFFTTTTLACHSGYCTSRMNLASSRLLTSSLMISSSIPGISVWDHARQSELDLRKSINLLFNPSVSLEPTLRCRIWSPSINGTSSISSTSGSSVC
uniref:Secreted protein n=1 Tax=Brassica oleracea var. oleracea TaxID=109376 RepID=A0A0D2ZPM1_BRAOL